MVIDYIELLICFAWRSKCQPTTVLLPGKSHGQSSLVGYSPYSLKELDTTEQLNFSLLAVTSHKESQD